MEGSLGSRVVALARLARTAGMDGVVCSALEAPAVRRELGPDFKILVPGVRPAAAATNDQSRIATPGDAVRAGADYLVVGRPITAAEDPRAAAREIVAEITDAERRGLWRSSDAGGSIAVAAGSISDYRADPDQAAYSRVLSPASKAAIGMD